MNRRPVVVRKILKFASLPIAALVILGFHLTLFTARDRFPNNVEPALELLTRIEQRELEDGSVIAINRGSVIEVTYTASERRVHLKTGEASFEVAKDPNRPFIVMAAGIDVKAVGTIFNVKLSTAKVDVIVKEGKVNVKVSAEASGHEESNAEAFLEIGHKATVQLDSSFRKVEVVRLDEAQLNEATYWQPRLLDYDSITLGELVKEFNRSNPIQVQFGDPSLESISLSSSFWSDNVEGFVRLMESSFGMKAEWRGSREIILNEKGV